MGCHSTPVRINAAMCGCRSPELMKIADKIIVFEKGKVVFEGTYQSFKAKK